LYRTFLGTTRDFIEDEIHIEGISFRFIDTAGIREARDKIEAIGVERTKQKMKAASVIIYLVDLTSETDEDIQHEKDKLIQLGIPYLLVGNKTDKIPKDTIKQFSNTFPELIMISASTEDNIERLKGALIKLIHLEEFITGVYHCHQHGPYREFIQYPDCSG
jgi:tRNA modification GTPase